MQLAFVRRSFCPGLSFLVLVAVLLAAPLTAFSQKDLSLKDLLNQGGSNSGSQKTGQSKLKITTSLTAAELKPGAEATLSITVQVPAGYYIYSQNRKFGGATRITVLEAAGLTALEETFQPDRAPKSVFEPLLETKVEKFYDKVTWSRKYRINADTEISKVSAVGKLQGQYCSAGKNGRCIPIRPAHEFTVALTQQTVSTEKVKELTVKGESLPFESSVIPTRKIKNAEKPDPLKLFFSLSPKNAQPGETVTLSITAHLEDDWHTFSLTQNPKNYGLPTKIAVERIHGLKPLGAGFTASEKPELEEPLEDGKIQEVHYGEISWTKKFEVLPTAEAGGYGVEGKIRYQICKKSCLLPIPVSFALGDLSTSLAFVDSTVETEVIASEKTGVTAPIDFRNLIKKHIDEQQDGEKNSLVWYLFTAFLGGILLNVMPCVLPVIAIKLMSFAQQAGEKKSRILALNISYSCGVMLVFLLLATAAVVLGLRWGGLFQHSYFNLLMACVVFAMGLSLLGVFEIPVPGFVGSAAGTHQQEGLLGAFLTGVFATLLATPCTGPFMAVALGWSIDKPAIVTFLIWFMVGLGMALPYLLVAIFPQTIKLLPKPGNWMVRLKEFSGFVLMGTVIFFINALEESFTVPALIMFLGIALGLWMIGNLYDVNSPIRHKTTVRISALLLMGLICGTGFSLAALQAPKNGEPIANVGTQPIERAGGSRTEVDDSELPWEPFSDARINELLGQKRTVLVDFSADWCLNCKVNERLALNTLETAQFVKKNNIVTLYADYTHESEEIKSWLDAFGSSGVPLTVIFPADHPDEPIIMHAVFTQDTLLENLQQAVDGESESQELSAN